MIESDVLDMEVMELFVDTETMEIFYDLLNDAWRFSRDGSAHTNYVQRLEKVCLSLLIEKCQRLQAETPKEQLEKMRLLK